ncbi:N-acetylmuramoyl-L-alanine amidase [Shimia abyssi]|uniref:N-acetylmuramoyl-L-alanine amidase n=1 Tax=Shimia abyssi TaxID=1662395 RepID=A0A2P8FJC7_9RHOB|nr:N-acetylmuramoyl-L-alanine amidase [Shimia abyssi]PSL21808.1 N-acetylmuramoyl-L-alanine amidase [Shimia abyssi]
MSRVLAVFVALVWAGIGAAQEFSGLARVDAEQSGLSEGWRGAVEFDLALSQGVPWRVFQLDEPRRLVLDFREIDWRGVSPEDFGSVEGVGTVRFGLYRPGWSRMVIDLDAPLAVDKAGLVVDEASGRATLSVVLSPVGPLDYAALAKVPFDPRWDLPEPAVIEHTRPERPDWAPSVVVIDPGHGGIDPGAERDGLQEKHLMLQFARELRDTLRRSGGFEVVLTRDEDTFVSLERRVAIAHQEGADVFISLHADIVSQGNAQGATVYTLSDEASDAASAVLAERHDRADILSGVDLSGADDEVTDVLLDLARMETRPRTEQLADEMVRAIREATGALNRKAHREAAFSVLKAADVPSILIELGFMSSKKDLANLRDPGWRASMASGIRDGLQAWVLADKAARPLVRQ